MRQELRFACRALVRSPTYAAAVIVTLVLGLGVNIAVATVAWSVLLRPLPIAEPDRVVMIYGGNSGPELRQPTSFVKFGEWRARNTVFDDVAVTTPLAIQMWDKRGEEIETAAVSDNFLRLLGVRPLAGRLLDAGDRHGTEGAVACVVSAPFARTIFGTTRPIGRRFEIISPDEPSGRTTLLIVGVMPDGFERWRGRVDVWIPAEAPHILWGEQLSSSGYLTFIAVGRLRSGVTIDQAGTAMSQLDRDVERELDGLAAPPLPLRLVPLRDDVVPPLLQRTLVLFSIAAGLVLAIAIANAGSLVLARLETRQTDVFIRAAIGASNADLFRYATAETFVLAAAGAAAGVPLAYRSLRFLGALAPAGISGQAVGFSGAIATYTIVLAFGVTIVLAAMQRFTTARAIREQTLRTGTPAAAARSSRLLDVLVAGEVAVAVVVVVAGTLVVRNFVRLLYVDPGFQPAPVLAVKLDVDSANGGPDHIARDRQVGVLIRLIRERALALPGVESAAVAWRAPLEPGTRRTSLLLEDGRRFFNGSGRDVDKTPDVFRVGAGYFEALGIPLRAGRVFTEDDNRPREPVVIVNETMARLHWPGLNPIGRRVKFTLSPSAPWATIVGLVGDVRTRSLHDPPRPQLYSPISESSQIAGALRLLVKTHEDPAALARPLATVFGPRDARVRMLGAQPMNDVGI
jgi:predicted permease